MGAAMLRTALVLERRYKGRIRLPKSFLIFLLAILMTACALPSSPAGRPASYGNMVQPLPTTIGVAAPICRLASCTNFQPVPGALPFPDTWQNIHRFQI